MFASNQSEDYTSAQPVNPTYVEFWGLEAEVSEGIAQLLLRLHDLGELTGQRLSQLDDMLVLPLVVAQDFDLSLQLHVHRPGAATQLLGENLPGTLQRRERVYDHGPPLHTRWTTVSMKTDTVSKKAGGEGYFVSVDAPLPHKVQFFNGWILQIIRQDHCSTLWR